MFIHLSVADNCFNEAAAELSSCDRNRMTLKPKIFLIWPFKKKFADFRLIECLRLSPFGSSL